jgi:hypothetical protein
MRIYLRLFAIFTIGVSIGCTTTFTMKVPKNAVANYLDCLEKKDGTCEEIVVDKVNRQDPILRTQKKSDRDKFKEIDTSPKDGFINPFSENANETMKDKLREISEVKDIKPTIKLVPNIVLERNVNNALKVMRSPVRVKLDEIYNATANPLIDTAQIKININDLVGYTQELAELNSNDGWEAYETAAVLNYAFTIETKRELSKRIKKLSDLKTPKANSKIKALEAQAKKANDEADKDLAIAVLLKDYYKAYFRNGDFWSGSIKLSNLIEKFPALENYPDSVKTEIEKALNKVQEKLVFGRIGGGGFVSRFGSKYQFPPLEV